MLTADWRQCNAGWEKNPWLEEWGLGWSSSPPELIHFTSIKLNTILLQCLDLPPISRPNFHYCDCSFDGLSRKHISGVIPGFVLVNNAPLFFLHELFTLLLPARMWLVNRDSKTNEKQTRQPCLPHTDRTFCTIDKPLSFGSCDVLFRCLSRDLRDNHDALPLRHITRIK